MDKVIKHNRRYRYSSFTSTDCCCDGSRDSGCVWGSPASSPSGWDSCPSPVIWASKPASGSRCCSPSAPSGAPTATVSSVCSWKVKSQVQSGVSYCFDCRSLSVSLSWFTSKLLLNPAQKNTIRGQPYRKSLLFSSGGSDLAVGVLGYFISSWQLVIPVFPTEQLCTGPYSAGFPPTQGTFPCCTGPGLLSPLWQTLLISCFCLYPCVQASNTPFARDSCLVYLFIYF